jgi:hypothetical protein
MKFNEMFNIKEGQKGLAESEKNINIGKNIAIRLGVLVGAIILFFVVLSIADKHSGALGALYLSMYFLGLWFFYIIVETVIFYILKKNAQAQANLFLIALIIMISSLIVYEFA